MSEFKSNNQQTLEILERKNVKEIKEMLHNEKYDCSISLDVIYHLVEDKTYFDEWTIDNYKYWGMRSRFTDSSYHYKPDGIIRACSLLYGFIQEGYLV